MAAHLAAPVAIVISEAWQQFSGARRLNDVDGPIRPGLRTRGVKWHQEVQAFTGVRIQRRKQRWVGDIEISLIERHLGGVLREAPFQAVAFERAPVLGVDRLVLPQERVGKIG